MQMRLQGDDETEQQTDLVSHDTAMLGELVLKQKLVHRVPKHQENERLDRQLVMLCPSSLLS